MKPIDVIGEDPAVKKAAADKKAAAASKAAAETYLAKVKAEKLAAAKERVGEGAKRHTQRLADKKLAAEKAVAAEAKKQKEEKYKKLVNKKMQITRKGKVYDVLVKNVDLENDKVTFIDMSLNKERTTSITKFDAYRDVKTTETEVAPKTVSTDVDYDKAVDTLWALESSRGQDKAGIKKIADDPSVTATGEMQQNNAFYKDITTRMGYPEYDRNNSEESKKAAKHYIKWVMDKEGFTLDEAVRSYKEGITGSKRGKGVAYLKAFNDIYNKGA
jgi:hypothetical protein